MRFRPLAFALATLALAGAHVGAVSAEEYGATIMAPFVPSNGGRYQTGESQSTVVPPGTPACPQGRILVSNDAFGPEQTGTVQSTALDGSDLKDATFSGLRNDNRLYMFSTNDHDLVSTANGTVYYITGAFSRKAIARFEPPWFTYAWRANANPLAGPGFGPGARSVVLTYKSLDCGKTFRYEPLMEMDPATVGDGSCALPQLPLTNDYSRSGAPLAYDAGGSDGQLAEADEPGGKIILTFGCVGYNRDQKKTAFRLDPDSPLRSTLVLESTGGPWKLVQTLPFDDWRLGVRSALGARIYATGTGLYFDYGQPIVLTSISGMILLASGNDVDGWSNLSTILAQDIQNPRPASYQCLVCINVASNPVIGRLGGALLFAYPADVGPGGQSHGYKLQVVTPADQLYYNQPAIEPRSAGNSLVEHVVLAKAGPALLAYWTDVNYDNSTTQVRGRWIISRSKSSADFDISEPVPFATKTNLDWYGDYQTAAGYVEPSGPVYTAFPVWPEGDGAVHVAKAEWTPEMLPLSSAVGRRAARKRIYRESVDASRVGRADVRPGSDVIILPAPPTPAAIGFTPRRVPINTLSGAARNVRTYRATERVREITAPARPLQLQH